jgi:2-oxoglutarate ferredoxin oxidoreductase subunit alpha
MQTVGEALCSIYSNAGFNIFANQDYMSRIRGGNNFFQLRIAALPAYTLRGSSDIIVALDKNSLNIHRLNLAPGGIMVLDKKKLNISEDSELFFDVPMYDIALKIGAGEIFLNSAACGVVSALTDVEFKYVEVVLGTIFGDKGPDTVRKNIEVARSSYAFVAENFKKNLFRIEKGNAKETFLMNGNDAIALGAIRAGCKFYSAYPMTPSTSIMNVIARYAAKFNILVEQAEDEIAAVNMAIGASFAGARAMTATSGGGFCLMVEGVSLAAMTETPVVIVEAQRPAPATGFPTRTEQADLDFVLAAGHGEFAKVIYTPGTIEEAFYLTVKAFNIAEEYQIPVFIMTDQHLADSYRNIAMFDLNKVKVQRHIVLKENSGNITNYKRYQLSESGVSPRALPGWINDVIYADSDEHSEEGHITEDAAMRTAMVRKRLYKKLHGLREDLEKPTAANIEGADIVLVGFGSSFGVLKNVADSFSGKKIGFIHLSQVWPFPEPEITDLLCGAKQAITVENNASGQLARLIRRETGIKIDKSILKFDGRPFDLDYLIKAINEYQ